jgi:hypothetical protein
MAEDDNRDAVLCLLDALSGVVADLVQNFVLLRSEIKQMSNTISIDIQNLTARAVELTNTVASETAAIQQNGSVVAEAIASLQSVVSTSDSLVPADKAALESAISTLDSVNTNLIASTGNISSQTTLLANALPGPISPIPQQEPATPAQPEDPAAAMGANTPVEPAPAPVETESQAANPTPVAPTPNAQPIPGTVPSSSIAEN